MKMDRVSLHVLTGIVSSVTKGRAAILVLLCVVSYFSLKPEGSIGIIWVSLLYVFFSVAVGFLAVLFDEYKWAYGCQGVRSVGNVSNSSLSRRLNFRSVFKGSFLKEIVG